MYQQAGMENLLFSCSGKPTNIKKSLDQMQLQIQKQALCASYTGQIQILAGFGEELKQMSLFLPQDIWKNA